MMEGLSSTKIYYENFCKCHNVPQYNNNMIIKNRIKVKQTFMKVYKGLLGKRKENSSRLGE
jgi:hypothetical protein